MKEIEKDFGKVMEKYLDIKINIELILAYCEYYAEYNKIMPLLLKLREIYQASTENYNNLDKAICKLHNMTKD